MSVTAADIAGYKAGTWNIDSVHSEVVFTVRHMGISKVKGQFTEFEGTIVTGETPDASSVEATVHVQSVSTKNEDRDNHLRTSDFFAADEYPTFSFTSNAFHLTDPANGTVKGELTMRGVTKEVEFDVELGGFGSDPYGNERVGITATTVINRQDFGISFGAVVEKTGNLVVSDKVNIELELSAILAA